MKAQARAQSELRSLIKQYDEMLHKNWELASEEQKVRIEAMRANNGTQQDEENIKSFLQAINPSQEELDQLFAEEKEEIDNAEETEETGNI